MKQECLFTVEEVLEVADRLRGMLDDEMEESNQLRKRTQELEIVLIKNGIEIPEYERWHGELTRK